MFFAAWFWSFFKHAMYPMSDQSPLVDGVWPPVGIVDPELVNDKDAKFAKTITLSYTFYEIDLPVDEAKFNSNYRNIDLNSDGKEGQLWHM